MMGHLLHPGNMMRMRKPGGLPSASPTHRLVITRSLYSFANVEQKDLRRDGRRNRGKMKREAAEVGDLVSGLCHMTEKQLKAVENILGPQILEAVHIAAKIDKTNQGRRRQEAYICKMIRIDLEPSDVQKLEEAVELSRTSQNSYVDKDLLNTVDMWREGIIQNDPEVLQDILTRLAAAGAGAGARLADAAATSDDMGADVGAEQGPDVSGGSGSGGSSGDENDEGVAEGVVPDDTLASSLMTLQEFRSLARQCQAASQELKKLREQKQAAQQAPASAASEPSSVVALPSGKAAVKDDDEDLEAILREAAKRAARRSGKGQSSAAQAQQPRPTATSGATSRKPLGAAQQEQADNTEYELAAKKHKKLMKRLNTVLKKVANL